MTSCPSGICPMRTSRLGLLHSRGIDHRHYSGSITKLAAVELPPGLTDIYRKQRLLEEENVKLRSALRQLGEAFVRLADTMVNEPHDEPSAINDLVRDALASLS